MDWIRQWVEALESGDYQQCFGTLRRDANTFCALGLAVYVYDPNHWTLFDNGEWIAVKVETLGTVISELATVGIHYPAIFGMNDLKRLDFKTIAKEIRLKLKENNQNGVPTEMD